MKFFNKIINIAQPLWGYKPFNPKIKNCIKKNSRQLFSPSKFKNQIQQIKLTYSA